MSGKLEAVLLHLLRLLKTDIEDYCDIETIDGGVSLVAQDGSMASIIKFNGVRSILSRDDYVQFLKHLETSLTPYFSSHGHQIQAVFRRELDASEPLEDIAIQQRATADRLKLDIHDLIEESIEKYSKYVCDEGCYLVLWSRPSLLDTTEARLSNEATIEFRKQTNYPPTKNAQNLLRPIAYLRNRHLSFVHKVKDDLTIPDYDCSAELLNVNEALRVIKSSVNRDITPRNWSASIPGTSIPFRWKSNGDSEDLSELLYPTLAQQIMTTSAEIGANRNPLLPDPTTIRVGNRVYAPLVISIPPRDPQYFNSLFNSLNRAETIEQGAVRPLPYSISFMLEGDGMSVLAFKALFSGILAMTSEQNRNINSAKEALNEFKRDGGSVVKLRICAMTWGLPDPEGVRELALRKSKLWRTLEGWGNPIVIERTGNPMDVFQSNVVGLTTRHIGAPCPAPLGDALSMLPLSRPASPFETGSIITRSLDGKILPLQKFSSEQTAWITLISGKMGSGKSVLLNNFNVECCLMPGINRLPYIMIIDIGISSSGFISLIKDDLPENLKHLAVYKRLQNSERDSINPMDTSLGKREPLPRDREFIKNFLSILITPPERRGKPYEGMSNFIGRVIDLAYEDKNDKYETAKPETYKPGHDAIVDNAINAIGYPTFPATTYWELVDAFFKEGMVYEAEVAQRYAVPTLNHLAATASHEKIKSEYDGIKTEMGSPLIDSFIVGIREAVAGYPLFSSHTRFDIGSARIASLDLQDVAISGSDNAYKQTALMYMISRQCFIKKVAFSNEDLPFFDETYKPYYEKLVKDIIDDFKVLCMDEYHKTGDQQGLKHQLLTDARESRKWQLEIILASQLPEDFGELSKIATAFYVLDNGTQETRRWLVENIGLPPEAIAALVNHVHGANVHGTTFLARYSTKTDTYYQLFTSTVGAMRLWALSTTAEDRKLRSLLYDVIPHKHARRLLAEKFPSGSCKKHVERLKEKQKKSSDFVGDEEQLELSVVENIAKDMIEEYFNTAQLEEA